MTIVPGIDVSRYQGVVNWRAVADAGFKFAVVRASLWDVKIDETFETNWRGARSHGLLLSAYNVIKPDVSAAAQIDLFGQALSGRKWDLPPVLDIERDDAQTPQQITQCVRDALRLSEQRFGRKPIVYTAKWFWNKFVLPSSEWAQYDLWVASYGVAEAQLPDAWPAWKIWQYTSNGHAPGIAGDVDLNWFNGSYDDLLKYCRTTPAPVPGARVRTKTTLNVRNGPGVNYADIGDLAARAEVTIGKVDGTDVWVQIEQGKWIALAYKGDRNARTEAGSGGLQVRVLVDTLNVRGGPGVDQPILDQLKKDAVVPLKDVDGKDAWGVMEPGKWIALAFKGEKYVEMA